MSYVALYRKFRPQTFDQIKGQEHVVRTLKNQLIYHRIGHAYLFTGTRGTGKTSAAKIFAKAVNCLHPVDGEPCNECENCRAINAGSFVDVVEVDAASNNGVDDIRRIIEEIRYTPVKGSYKVFIIDEAHMITGPAFNAFLKTLEEPPAYAVFILATTEPHKLPVTILSRCQRYDFRRIRSDEIAANLSQIISREGVEAEDKALAYIAQAADGSMRDAVSLLDKCIAFNLGEKLTYDNVLNTLGTVDTAVFSALFRSISEGDVTRALQRIDEAVAEGRDLTQYVTDLIWYLRNVLMVQAAQITDPQMLGLSAENMQRLAQDAGVVAEPVLMRYIRILSELLNQIRFSSAKQVLTEVAVIRMAKPQMETDTHSLEDRIRQMEQRISGVQIQAVQNVPQAAAHIPAQPAEQPQQAAQSQQAAQPQQAAEVLPAEEPQAAAAEPSQEIPPQQAPEDDFFAGLSIPPAAPEEEQNIWHKIMDLCSMPRVRFTLNKCTAEIQGNDLIRIYAASDFMVRQLREEQTMAYISQLAEQAAGRRMQIQVAPAGSRPNGSQAGAFPEELLKNINFNIGTEEW